jgi:HEAT repeat protein
MTRLLLIALAGWTVLGAPDQALGGPTAEDIVKRAIQAQGGRGSPEEGKVVQVRSKGTTNQGTWTSTLTMRLPGQFKNVARLEVQDKPLTLVQVLNGDKVLMSQNGRLQPLTSQVVADLKETRYAAYVASLTPLLDRQTFTLSLLGESPVNGQSAVGVKVESAGHREIRLDFDKASGLLVKTSRRALNTLTRTEHLHEEFRSGFRDVEGGQQPTRFEVRMDGNKIAESEIVEARYLDTLADGLFDRVQDDDAPGPGWSRSWSVAIGVGVLLSLGVAVVLMRARLRKRKRLPLGLAVLLVLAIGVVCLIPATRLTILGHLRDEPFHRGKPVSLWVHQLGSRDSVKRVEAATALGEMGSRAKAAVPGLSAALEDEHPDVRREAAFALGAIGPDASAAIPILIETTAKEPQDSVLMEYTEILLALGPEAVSPLTAALRHTSSRTRAWAAYTLSRFGRNAREAIPALVEALSVPSLRETVRRRSSAYDWQGLEFYQIAVTLGDLGAEARPAVPLILDFLRDGAEPIYYNPPSNQPLDLLAALKSIDPSLTLLIDAREKLRDPSRPESEAALTTLIGALGSKEKRTRELAAFILSECQALPYNISPAERDAAIAALTRALEDEIPGVRWSAAPALVRMTWIQPHPRQDALYRSALPVLVEALAKDRTHARVRALAANAFRHFPGSAGADLQAGPVLLEALNDPDQRVQREALFALAAVSRRPEHVQAVVRRAITLLRAKRVFPTDQQVIGLLGELGPAAAEAVPVLQEILDKDLPQAARGVSTSGGGGPMMSIAGTEAYAKQVRDALKRIDPKAAADAD